MHTTCNNSCVISYALVYIDTYLEVDVFRLSIFSVSDKALHAYSTDTNGVGLKTDDEEQVAYWGNKVWGGP